MTKTNSVVVLVFSLFPLLLSAQNNSLDELKEKHSLQLSIHPAISTPRFIRFSANNPLALIGANLTEKTTAFFEKHGLIFGVKDNTEELKLVKNTKDDYGNTHLHFQQKIEDIPVYGADLRLHFDKNNKLTAINGVFIPDIYINPTPDISAQQAAEKAASIVHNQTSDYASAPLFVHKNELKFFNKGLVVNQIEENHLVYEIEVRNDADVREFLFIDAHTGKLVEQYTGMAHALHRRLYETNTSNTIWDEGDAFPGTLDIWEQNELAAAEDMYNLFKNSFGFISYDGADAMMRTIHNNPSISCPNANWNGSTANYCTGTASDDVVAHEWGHAYTEYTSGLIYAWQSGALNESYSDIWGETVDLLNNYEDTGEDLSLRTACNSSLRWILGEDATAFSSALRDMHDPTCKNDPGKVSDSQYACSTGDSGGVHTNSGVNNRAYSLLVDGGTFNGQTITALGFTKTAHIFWRAQSVYLTPTSDFNDQADALETSCADLLGINLEGLTTETTAAGLSGEIITLADCQMVSNVITAVEFRDSPPCTFTPILAQSPPALCSDPLVENNIFYEDFEGGAGLFTATQTPTNPGTWETRTWTHDTTLPKSRSGSAMFGTDPINGNCTTDLENGIITLVSPVISLPTGRNSPIHLTFEHYVATEFQWDGGNLKYSINGTTPTIMPSSAFTFNSYNNTLNTAGAGNDNPLAGEDAFTGTDGGSLTSTWGKSQVNLTAISAFAGNTIQFFWELGTDGCNGNDGWYIDNVQVCTCETSALPVQLTSFKSSVKEKDIVLDWSTETEVNNQGFELQRSLFITDNFEKITWVNGKGNSSQSSDYQFIDKEAEAGINYFYRLKQIDFDGQYAFSEVVSAKVEENEKGTVLMYPNPAKNSLFFQNATREKEDFTVSIFHINGQLLIQKRMEEMALSLDISGLPDGIYFVKIKGQNGEKVQRLVVSK